jgi:hypothetical protein
MKSDWKGTAANTTAVVGAFSFYEVQSATVSLPSPKHHEGALDNE